MLVASGCGVPGIAASRTMEQDRDRKMTVMTACFILRSKDAHRGAGCVGTGPAAALRVATAAYLIGVLAAVLSGILLKKTKPFSGNPAPFVMELPAYHAPSAANVLRSTWERGWGLSNGRER